MIDELLNQLRLVLDDPFAKVIIGHTLINLVAALAAALKTGTLDLEHVKSFVLQKLLPNLAVFTVAKLVGGLAGLDWLAGVAWAAVEADLLGDLADSLGRLGLPMPGGLVKGQG